MTLSEKFNSFKADANTKLEEAKTFCREHSVEIAEGAVMVAAGCACACGVLVYSNNNKSKALATLTKACKELMDDSIKSHQRIDELADLCHQKDVILCKTMSDGLRHGSSLAAQQMVARKQMLS